MQGQIVIYISDMQKSHFAASPAAGPGEPPKPAGFASKLPNFRSI